MLTRAAIVILVILNLGVATWWATRSETPLPPPVERETGVATLELLPVPANAVPATVPQTPELAPASASALAAAPAPAPAPAAAQTTVASSTEPMRAAAPEPVPAPAAPPAEPKPVVAVEQCLSLGPFAERAKAEAALARLRDGAARSRLREAAATASGSYRVWIPPAASRELAQATAKRIVEAGFSDYYVIAQGEDANAVALGQYRNRDGAERRLAALKAAGFGAAVISGSAAAASWWIDTALLPGSTAQGIVGSSGAPRSQSLDCARLR